VPVFGGLLIIYQKGEPLIFQEEMSGQVETLTVKAERDYLKKLYRFQFGKEWGAE
jgi:hypothetical protein